MHVREAPLSATPTTPTNQRLTPLLFVGLMLGLLLAELDQTMFSTALPTIVGELGGVDRMLWVTTAYVLAGTVVMPVYGKLGDLLGRKPLFIAALSIFVAGCLLGGLAPDMTWLIVARAVQGLGGGGLLILIQAIIADLVPARERAASMTIVGAVFALSAMLGPVLGGWLTDGLGWRWAFWINLPLGAAAIASGAAFLPSARGRVRPVRIDVPGIAAMTVAVTAIVWWRRGAVSPTPGGRPSSSRSAPLPYWPVRSSSPLNARPPTRLSRWRCFGIGPSQRRRSPVW